jgi:hypothetical protein
MAPRFTSSARATSHSISRIAAPTLEPARLWTLGSAFGKDGSLYVVQIADTGLLDPAPTGSVVKIPAGGGAAHEMVVAGLTAPYGITLHGHSAYVTTCSTCAGGGEVLRVALGGGA